MSGRDDSEIEAFAGPPVYVDEAQRLKLEKDTLEPMSPTPPPDARQLQSLRITRKDLETDDYTDGCKRCPDISIGFHATNANHSTRCRARMYSGDAKE